MRGDLGIYFPNEGGDTFDWYIPADALLNRVATTAGGGRGAAAPGTSGLTEKTAWQLNTHDDWVGAWQKLLTDGSLKTEDVYFKVAGRTIKKNRRGHSTGDGFYMSDIDLSGTDPSDGNIWSRNGGASYREFGKFFQANKPVAPLEQVTWSKQIADELRGVLMGNKDYSAADGTDVRSALPMLACAMFLAEPARNGREWIIGKMMLDLIGEQYAAPNAAKGKGARFYELDRVFSHPLRLDPGYKGSKPLTAGEAQSGPTTDRYKVDNGVRRDQPQPLVPFTTKDQLARVEGKYPASPAKSAATSVAVNVADDYIQKKEASIACRWVAAKLTAMMGPDSHWRFTPLKPGGATGKVNLMTATFDVQPTRKACKSEFLQIISDFLIERAKSFA
jgi:hypothetical protein